MNEEVISPDLQQVLAQLKRIQEQMGYLERKIDQILTQSQGAGRPFPRKDFGHPAHARPARSAYPHPNRDARFQPREASARPWKRDSRNKRPSH